MVWFVSVWVSSNITSVTHTHIITREKHTDTLDHAHTAAHSQLNTTLSLVYTHAHFPLLENRTFPASGRPDGKNVWTNLRRTHTRTHTDTQRNIFNPQCWLYIPFQSPSICTLAKWSSVSLLNTIGKQDWEVSGPQWCQCRAGLHSELDRNQNAKPNTVILAQWVTVIFLIADFFLQQPKHASIFCSISHHLSKLVVPKRY